MIDRKWSIALLLATVAVAGAFASGDKDADTDEYGPRGGRPGMMRGDSVPEDRAEAREERFEELLEDAETYRGRFTMVEGEYPALVDADGETWYLMIPCPVDDENIPAEGADIEVQALKSRMSPVHLNVLVAEVDGEELDLDWAGGGPRGGGQRSGGRRG